MSSLFTVILAAGQGKRMQSSLPKVLHTVGGWPLVRFPLEIAVKLKPDKAVLVVSKSHEAVREAVSECPLMKRKKLVLTVQAEQRGTGDALVCALKAIPGKKGTILLMNGDMPLILENSVRQLLQHHRESGAVMTLLSVRVNSSLPYGRVVRDTRGHIRAVIEERDCTEEQKRITELNCGVYAIDLEFARSAVKKIRPQNAQSEYYVTDLVKIAVDENRPVATSPVADVVEAMGVNSQRELWAVNRQFYLKQRERLWAEGVRSQGADILIDADVKIGAGTILLSPCYLHGQTHIGANVVLESGTVVRDCTIEDGAQILSFSYLEGAQVGKNCRVGPFAHLREGTELAVGAKIGNFVETKKARIGAGSKVNHLAYMGDITTGERVNVGAGTITCNYDGHEKFKTVLEDDVFIGSDTQLVAPVRIGRGAVIGAGTTVTRNVKPESLTLSRVRQMEIPGWAKKRRRKK